MPMVIVKADMSGLRNEAKITREALAAISQIVDKAQTSIDSLGNKGSTALSKVGKDTTGVANAVGGLVLRVASLGAALYAFKSMLDAQISLQRLEKAYQTIFGDGTRAQLDLIHEQTSRVGLGFMSTAEAAKGFFAAGKDTTLAPKLNDIFIAVTNAAGALQLTTDQTNGVFIALGQMMSKGKVQAEELRGQLGERLPGAFQLAAQAMGMTTAELDKFMANGQLTAEELLPKLADVLQNKFAVAAAAAADTAQGAINRMSSEWELFKASVLDSESVVSILNRVTDALERRNSASARDKERGALESQLKGMGIGPDQQSESFDFQGERHTTSSYSEGLLTWMRNMNAGWRAENEISEQNAKETDRVLAEGRKAVEEALKDTPKWKAASLQKEKEQSEAAIKNMIAAYTADGLDTSDLQAQLNEVAAAYDKKIEDVFKKANRGGAGLANRQFRFDTGLEQLRQEVANMEATLNPVAQGIDKIRQKLELERQNAIAAAEAHAKLSVQRKEATPDEANDRMDLEVKKANLTYQQRMAEAEEKGRQSRIEFYREYASLSGDFMYAIEGQTEAIRKQGQEFRSAGVTEELVRQWSALKRLESARDPYSGILRGMRRWVSESTDLAKQFETTFTSAMDQTSDVLTDFVMTGELDLERLGQSIERMFIKMMIQQAMARLMGGIFGGFMGGGMFFAHGGVMSGGDISGYRNSVVTRPTVFSFNQLHPFASGGGLMGEAGPEAIMPLTRTATGDLGVRALPMAGGGGRSDSQVNVNIINASGEEVTQRTKTDNYGNKTIDVMIGDAAAKQAMIPGTGMNRAVRAATGAKTQVTRR